MNESDPVAASLWRQTLITKASFAELELPRLLSEVKYSNIQGEQPFSACENKI